MGPNPCLLGWSLIIYFNPSTRVGTWKKEALRRWSWPTLPWWESIPINTLTDDVISNIAAAPKSSGTEGGTVEWKTEFNNPVASSSPTRIFDMTRWQSMRMVVVVVVVGNPTTE